MSRGPQYKQLNSNLSLILHAEDTSGNDKTDLTAATAGLVVEYRRSDQSAWTAVTLVALSALTDPYTSGGFLHDSQGDYRLDLPNVAATTTAASWVAVRWRGASGLATGRLLIPLHNVNYQDGARFGMTGVVLAGAQAYNNTGQTQALPADAQKWGGNTINGNYATDFTNVAEAVGLIKAKTDSLTFTAPGKVDASGNWLTTLGATAPANWINAAAVAANALNGKGDWMTGLGATAPAGWITGATLAAGALNGKGDWLTPAGYTAPDNAGIAAAAGAATSADNKLTAGRLGKLDSLTFSAPNKVDTDARASADAAKVVTDKLATTLENDPANAGKSRLTAAALSNAPAGGSGSGGAAGPGASPCTLTVTRPDGVTPIADADVWLTAVAGSPTPAVAGTLQTDSNGRVTFLLDAGATYYLWAQKDGERDIRGQSFVAVKD